MESCSIASRGKTSVPPEAAVSFHVLASGALVGDPQRREGSKGPFTTAIIRAVDGDGAIFVSVIGFGAEVERLLEFAKGDALAVSGRAKLTAWSARDGTEKRGASVVAAQIAAAKPRSKTGGRVVAMPNFSRPKIVLFGFTVASRATAASGPR
jgi:single-stranded DNA-binding protein